MGDVNAGGAHWEGKGEKELKLIEDKLEYNKEEKRWISEYQWIRDPSELPDNKKAAMGMLISTEQRLAKNKLKIWLIERSQENSPLKS